MAAWLATASKQQAPTPPCLGRHCPKPAGSRRQPPRQSQIKKGWAERRRDGVGDWIWLRWQ